jgi:hypothetical protein
MQKKYWWRIFVVIFASVIFGYGNIAVSMDELNLYNPYIDPLMFLSLALLAVSPFLFFARDDVFRKWLGFSGIWFGVAAVLIALSPEYSGGWGPSFNPTKESISIWMSSLFVIISLAKISWDSRKPV